jgi:mono/diheme cytochrome c family protein
MRASLFTFAFTAVLLHGASLAKATEYGIGKTATPAEIAGWNIDIAPTGAGLPPGHGSVGDGARIYADKCAACHGADGLGKPMPALAGGAGTMGSAKPEKTVGSFWPYATTLYDYIHRAMPFNAPQTLAPDEVYAVSAYVLYLNHLVPEDAVLDATSLPAVVMPERGKFVSGYVPGQPGEH